MTLAENYKQNLDKTRLLSKMASFLIAVILLVEVFSNLKDLFFSEVKWTAAYFDLLKLLTMQALVGIIFTLRFVFLFLQKPKSVLFSQIIWFIGWLLVFAYFAILFGFPWSGNQDGHIYFQLSIYKSLLALVPYFYLLLSPIHQILHLIIAFLHRKKTYAEFTF
jgi:hypothetical protein